MSLPPTFTCTFHPGLTFRVSAGDQLLAHGVVHLYNLGGDLLAGLRDDPPIPSAAVQSDLGAGLRQTTSARNGQIEARLTVDQYPQWPGAWVLQWTFTNLSGATLAITRLATPELNLDPAWAALSAGLWSFQGAAVAWGQDFAFPLQAGFARENSLDHIQNGEGGGIPLVYFWNPQAGLALAHIEPEQQPWHMPVRADAAGVQAGLVDPRPFTLRPGQSVSSLRTLLSCHTGDFFAPLDLYRRILAAQGLVPAQPNSEDYAPAWCSWGYEFDVRPEEITGVLPALRDLDIHWLTLDDRWFDRYGDWNPRSDTFPGGEAQMREMVDRIHAAGGLAQLWWYPLCVEDGEGGWDDHRYGQSDCYRQHPDWLLLNADGSVARNNRGLAIICPGLSEVRGYTLDLARCFIQDYGFDGFKMDNIYTVPACHNPAHQHASPEDARAGFARVYREILDQTRAFKPYSVTQICPCGTPPAFSLLPAMDQAVTADPTSSAQVRQRIKFYKAVLGPRAAVFADHVELSDGGADFASAIGAGGIPATKFVWPEDTAVRSRLEEWWGLSPDKRAVWKEWLARYAAYPLAEGEYLNLYDLAFDRPEAHAIRLRDRLYYAFFTPDIHETYTGPVELRGLGAGAYRVTDYVNQQTLGQVHGPQAVISVQFTGSLLLEADSAADADATVGAD